MMSEGGARVTGGGASEERRKALGRRPAGPACRAGRAHPFPPKALMVASHARWGCGRAIAGAATARPGFRRPHRPRFLFYFFEKPRPSAPAAHAHSSPLPSPPAYPGAERFNLHYGDLIDFGSLCSLLR